MILLVEQEYPKFIYNPVASVYFNLGMASNIYYSRDNHT